MNKNQVAIYGMGMVSSVGLDTNFSASSVRAGIAKFEQSQIYNKHLQPMVLSMLPGEVLPPLSERVAQKIDLTSRQTRMLRLATPALQEVTAGFQELEKIPVFLGIPEVLPERKPPVSDDFLTLLSVQSGVNFNIKESHLIPGGQTAGLAALDEALKALMSEKHEQVLVGGVDTFIDLYLLALLDSEDRILADGVMNGFVASEGAAFLLLSTTENIQTIGKPLAFYEKVGIAQEEGHRYSDKTYSGDGLANACKSALEGAGQKVKTVYAGLNGEHLGAKEWGVAYLRNSDSFNDDFLLEHPIDCLGDPGAALGPMLVSLAIAGFQGGYVEGPCLVWCSSDYGRRAAVLLHKN